VGWLDQIRAGQRTKPSRNEMAKVLLEEAIEREADRMALRAQRSAPKAQQHTPPAETPVGEGTRLRLARAAAGLSQEALAANRNVSEDQVRRFEAGRAIAAYAADILRAWLLEHDTTGGTT
jgi:ribosome-binding protein aMBF1 (putative translation factor)